ncbi:MAG: aldo/keto reductase [Bryobacteraceae bacterium]
MPSSYATAEGTARYAARFPRHQANSFFRRAQDLTVSSLGIGSYLGNIDDATDAGYLAAVQAAVRGGVNFIDTSLNYRHQSSERNIGAALAALFAEGAAQRDEVVLCTKAGYLIPNAFPGSKISPADVVGRMHCMTPPFLEDQLERSLANLRVETIDVLYLHNPETQLEFVDRAEFGRRTRAAFEALEREASRGRIRYYGAATWNGFRTKSADEGLSLTRMEALARDVAGDAHRFRFIQLPFNLAMLEGAAIAREHVGGSQVSTLDAAVALGITAVASASIFQARLSRGLPDEVARALPGLDTDAQRAIQFARSAPGISVALVGMSKVAHVEENLGVAAVAPDSLAAWFRR